MKNTKVTAIAEGAVIAALTVLMLVMAVYLPFFSLFSVFLAGIPLAYLAAKHNPGIAGISALAALLVFFVITGDLFSVLMLGVTHLLPGFLLGICFRKKCKFHLTLLTAAGAVAAGIVLDLLIINYSAGGHGIEDMVIAMLHEIEQMLTSFADKMQALGGVPDQELHGMIQDLVKTAEMIIRTFVPSFIMIVSLVIGYITYMLTVFVLRRTQRETEIHYLPFSDFKAPKSMCYAVVVMFLVVRFTAGNDIFTAALSNMVVIMYFLIGVCGLSFLDAKLKKKVPSGYLRFLIYAVGFLVGYIFISILGNILIMIGLADGILDFRHLNKRGEGYVDGE